MTKWGAAVLVASLVCTASANDKVEGWVDLFDGKTLTGWKVLNGTATYEVKDGTIVGITAKGSPNSFLCTEKQYGDFELEFEVKVDDKLNSGVQIRSLLKGGDKGRLFGPQVEIEAGPGQAGFVYGEAMGGGWLSAEPKSKDKAINSHAHFKNGEWNKYRIVAKGNTITTFINGNKITELKHDGAYKSHPKGVIGLQVHSIPKKKGPFQVAWKNLRIREIK